MAGIGLANLVRNLAYPGQTSSFTGMSLAVLSPAQKISEYTDLQNTYTVARMPVFMHIRVVFMGR